MSRCQTKTDEKRAEVDQENHGLTKLERQLKKKSIVWREMKEPTLYSSAADSEELALNDFLVF